MELAAGGETIRVCDAGLLVENAALYSAIEIGDLELIGWQWRIVHLSILP
jgi:hypothetical protein